MKIKNTLLIILTSAVVLLSLLVSRLYFENVKLIKALKLSNQLIDNTSAAYKEFGDCVTNPQGCNYDMSKAKLESLNQEKSSIQLRLDALIGTKK